jgi:hypothetical protein
MTPWKYVLYLKAALKKKKLSKTKEKKIKKMDERGMTGRELKGVFPPDGN